MKFTGDTKVDSVLHQKVITNGLNQAGQIISIDSNLSRYIGNKGYLGWAESTRLMQKKKNATSCQLPLIGVPMGM